MVSSKYGPSIGSGLSKIAMGWKSPARNQAFHCELAPRNVALHLQFALANLRNPPERRHELASVVGADHAPAGRKPQRLQHARVRRTRGHRRRIVREAGSEECAARASPPPETTAARCVYRGRRVPPPPYGTARRASPPPPPPAPPGDLPPPPRHPRASRAAPSAIPRSDRTSPRSPDRPTGRRECGSDPSPASRPLPAAAPHRQRHGSGTP